MLIKIIPFDLQDGQLSERAVSNKDDFCAGSRCQPQSSPIEKTNTNQSKMGNSNKTQKASKIEFAPSNDLHELLSQEKPDLEELKRLIAQNPDLLETEVGTKNDHGGEDGVKESECECESEESSVSGEGSGSESESESGNEVEKKDRRLYPLFFLTAKSGSVPAAKILVEHGVDPLVFVHDVNALHFACLYDQRDMIDYLMGLGLSPDAPQDTGANPIETVVVYGHLKTLLYLASKGIFLNKQIREKGNITLMEVAIAEGKVEMVEFLLDDGIDVTLRKERERMSPLEQAVVLGKLDLVKLFSSKSVNMSKKDAKGHSLLHLAAQASIGMVELLLDAGFDVDAQEIDGFTPLMFSANNSKYKTTKLLIERGAKLDLVNKKGETALYRASKKDHGSIVKLLLDKGADPSIVADNGMTCRDVAAVEYSDQALVHLNFLFEKRLDAKLDLILTAVQGLSGRLTKLEEASEDDKTG